MAGPVFLLFFFFLPETQPATILLRRAQRLRKITGNEKLMSQSEIDQRHFKFSAQVLDAMIKPIEISLKDPAILFVNVYTALTYGIYYSFFEVFPLVFGPLYHMNVGETGTVFICLIIGCFIAMAIYFAYLHFYLIPDILRNGLREQEHRLQPALIACIGPTVGLFLFGKLALSPVCVCGQADMQKVGLPAKIFTGSFLSSVSLSTASPFTSSCNASSSMCRCLILNMRLRSLPETTSSAPCLRLAPSCFRRPCTMNWVLERV